MTKLTPLKVTTQVNTTYPEHLLFAKPHGASTLIATVHRKADNAESLAWANCLAAAPALLDTLKAIVRDLPTRRDWLDPALEQQARDVIRLADGTLEPLPQEITGKPPQEITPMVALQKLVDLQRHYSELLNDYDGGQRKGFTTAEEWMARLQELADKK